MKKILLVDSIAEGRGFFSTINLLLLTILYCKENNLSPVISSSVLSLYGTNPKTIRPFSEFFGNIFLGEPNNLDSLEISYVHNKGILDFNDPEVISSLSSINKIIVNNINHDLKIFINKPPLGVNSNSSISIHYRGCDYLKNTPFNHIQNSNPKDFLKKISNLIIGEGVFVATDDISFISQIKALGNNVSYFEDVYRKGPGRGAHIKSLFDKLGLTNKQNQKRKGYEVIRDVFWLSKNNLYIGSNSNLMYYSKLLNSAQHQINTSAII
jgi:hypothetical protein